MNDLGADPIDEGEGPRAPTVQATSDLARPTSAVQTTVTLIVIALDEIDGMNAIMPRVPAGWCDQILVLDGGSRDGTAQYAASHGYDVYVQKRRGIRHAMIEGLSLARGDIVVTFSPDGNCVPELVPELIDKMCEGYDMVIVSRYLGGARSEDDDVVTGFGNWLFTRLINLLHGGCYTDAMGIFRAYRASLFYELGLDREDGYAPEKLFRTVIGIEPLLSIRCAKRGLRVGEIPGDEPARVGGRRKLQMVRWGAAYLAQIFRELYYWR